MHFSAYVGADRYSIWRINTERLAARDATGLRTRDYQLSSLC